MRPSPAQLDRVAAELVQRLLRRGLLEPTDAEAAMTARIAAMLRAHFEEEAEIDREAEAEAEKLVRRGAPGIRREDLDLRRVEQLVKQRLAKARGFPL